VTVGRVERSEPLGGGNDLTIGDIPVGVYFSVFR